MKPTVIDVREPSEFASGHVAGAINIPLGEIQRKIVTVVTDKDTPLILYCRTGNRSGMAKSIVDNLGYKSVSNGIDQRNVEKLLNTA